MLKKEDFKESDYSLTIIKCGRLVTEQKKDLKKHYGFQINTLQKAHLKTLKFLLQMRGILMHTLELMYITCNKLDTKPSIYKDKKEIKGFILTEDQKTSFYNLKCEV